MKLSLYRDGQYVLDYMAFLVARRTAPGTINQHISAAKKILQFLDGRDPSPWPHTAALSTAYSRQVTVVVWEPLLHVMRDARA